MNILTRESWQRVRHIIKGKSHGICAYCGELPGNERHSRRSPGRCVLEPIDDFTNVSAFISVMLDLIMEQVGPEPTTDGLRAKRQAAERFFRLAIAEMIAREMAHSRGHSKNLHRHPNDAEWR